MKIFKELRKKFNFVAMATRVFDGIKVCEQFLKRTSQGTFLPSLVQNGPAVWEKMFNSLAYNPDLTTLKKKSFKSIVGNGDNAVEPFSPFPTMFSARSKTLIFVLATIYFYLLSANALNLVKSKNLSFGKELKKLLMTHDGHITTLKAPLEHVVLR